MEYINGIEEDFDRAIKVLGDINMLRNRNILVTGACGMIGSAVVDLLLYIEEKNAYGLNVFAGVREEKKYLMRFEKYKNNKFLKYVYYDAEKEIELEDKIDYIIHAAGNASPQMYVNYPVEVMSCNYIGMMNILKYSQKAGVKRVLYISSSEIYGMNSKRDKICENEYGYLDILNSRMCYPSSKRATETLCQSFLSEYGVDVVIARPGHIYGPTALESDTKASSLFARSALKGEDIVLKSDGRQLRSYCYVYDCASAILKILISGEKGNAYNISNPESICSIRQLAETFALQSGVNVIFDNPTDAEKVAFNPMNNSSLDECKIYGIGWRGSFNLKEGVERTLKYTRNSIQKEY